YAPVGAYDGGSSLVLEGTLDGDARWRLFLTALEVTDSTRLSLTACAPAGTRKLTAAFALADDPETMIERPLAIDLRAGDWVTGHVDLSEHAGRTLSTLGIGVHTDEQQTLQVNLGALTVAPPDRAAPQRPRGFTIQRALAASQELVLSWERDDFADVSRYEVCA